LPVIATSLHTNNNVAEPKADLINSKILNDMEVLGKIL
jgi:hypothetical protein